jgi:glycosyltransferase involved in cell wall biosynthesis
MLNIAYIAALELGKPDAANQHTFEIVTLLAKRNHQITLFIPTSKNTLSNISSGIQIIQSPAFGSRASFLFSLSFYLLLPWSVWIRFWRIRPNLVYTRFSFLDFLVVSPLRLFFHFKYIAEVNGVPSLESQGGSLQCKFIHWLEKLSLNQCDQAISVTPELQNWIVNSSRLTPKKVKCIGNGVDPQQFLPISVQQACQTLGLDSQIVYLNYTGSFKRWHGAQILIQALPEIINNSSKPVQLLLIGDGPEKSSLQSLAIDLDVDQSIRWIGKISRNLVPLYINASTICLAPIAPGERTRIGLAPLKVFEYMSCARPIVTNRIGASYDDMIAKGPYGLLVELNNPSAFAQAVLELIEHPQKAQEFGLRCRQAVLDNYSWDHIVDQTESFLLDSLKSRK